MSRISVSCLYIERKFGFRLNNQKVERLRITGRNRYKETTVLECQPDKLILNDTGKQNELHVLIDDESSQTGQPIASFTFNTATADHQFLRVRSSDQKSILIIYWPFSENSFLHLMVTTIEIELPTVIEKRLSLSESKQKRKYQEIVNMCMKENKEILRRRRKLEIKVRRMYRRAFPWLLDDVRLDCLSEVSKFEVHKELLGASVCCESRTSFFIACLQAIGNIPARHAKSPIVRSFVKSPIFEIKLLESLAEAMT